MTNKTDKMNKKQWEKGVVSVYMALTVVIVMVASTLILTDVIFRQFRSATDVEFTERAFYAASSGFERASYIISQTGEPNVPIVQSGTLEYAEGSATYDVDAIFDVNDSNQIIYASTAICSEGDFRDATRRLIYGSEDSC